MQPGFFRKSKACLLSSFLTTTTLWGSLCSSLLTTTLWSCLLSSSFLTTTTLWGSLCSSLLTTTLWSCLLSSSFLTTLCSHVVFLSEWFDPSPNLLQANRDTYWPKFPLFGENKLGACRITFSKKCVYRAIFIPLFTHFLCVNIAIFAKLKKKRLFKTLLLKGRGIKIF